MCFATFIHMENGLFEVILFEAVKNQNIE
jgi:hypothetical protein